jgi:hypothetical protein
MAKSSLSLSHLTHKSSLLSEMENGQQGREDLAAANREFWKLVSGRHIAQK